MNRRRIQPKPAVELTPLSVKLPADLVRRMDAYAKFLRGTHPRCTPSRVDPRQAIELTDEIM